MSSIQCPTTSRDLSNRSDRRNRLFEKSRARGSLQVEDLLEGGFDETASEQLRPSWADRRAAREGRGCVGLAQTGIDWASEAAASDAASSAPCCSTDPSGGPARVRIGGGEGAMDLPTRRCVLEDEDPGTRQGVPEQAADGGHLDAVSLARDGAWRGPADPAVAEALVEHRRKGRSSISPPRRTGDLSRDEDDLVVRLTTDDGGEGDADFDYEAASRSARSWPGAGEAPR